jgi:flagellar basal-body rod protein FlgF
MSRRDRFMEYAEAQTPSAAQPPELSPTEIATLVEDYLPLVVSQADRVWLSPRIGLTREDLVSAGCYGLLLAARRFDPTRGVGFGVFARSHVHGALMREINAAMKASGATVDDVLAASNEVIEPDSLPATAGADSVAEIETTEVRELMECILTESERHLARPVFFRGTDLRRNRRDQWRFGEQHRARDQGGTRQTQGRHGRRSLSMNPLYLAASGAASQLAELDVTASNLANSSTPGFRRFLNVIEAVGGNGSPFEYATAQATPTLDLAQGPISATGNPFDVAITGTAFIAVDTPDGPAYTRNGALQLAPDGTLLAAGQPVSSDGGGGPIKLPAGAITIAADGSIAVGGTPAAKIALADPAGVTMVARGVGLYGAADGAALPTSAEGDNALRQGFLESSTGSSMGAMVAMMNVMRSYEATMHSVQSIDENQDHANQAFTLQA